MRPGTPPAEKRYRSGQHDEPGLTSRGGIGENAFLRAGGGVAQLGEHHVRNVGVGSSILLSSTILRSSELRMVPAAARSAKSGTTFPRP